VTAVVLIVVLVLELNRPDVTGSLARIAELVLQRAEEVRPSIDEGTAWDEGDYALPWLRVVQEGPKRYWPYLIMRLRLKGTAMRFRAQPIIIKTRQYPVTILTIARNDGIPQLDDTLKVTHATSDYGLIAGHGTTEEAHCPAKNADRAVKGFRDILSDGTIDDQDIAAISENCSALKESLIPHQTTPGDQRSALIHDRSPQITRVVVS
jgi:hypothetical protein